MAGIAVDVEWLGDGSLALTYRLAAHAGDVHLPPVQAPGPADNLWQTTCCEAFVAGPGAAYREFNFSPSGQWAAYAFDDYRQRDSGFAPPGVPHIALDHTEQALVLTATLPPALLPPGDGLLLGLTAVIETAAGSKHYWALTHTAAQPDFHPRASFTLALSRPTCSS